MVGKPSLQNQCESWQGTWRETEAPFPLLFLEGTCTICLPLRSAYVTFKVGCGHIALFADCCTLRDLGTSHLVEVIIGLWGKVALGVEEKGKALSSVNRRLHLENA